MARKANYEEKIATIEAKIEKKNLACYQNLKQPWKWLHLWPTVINLPRTVCWPIIMPYLLASLKKWKILR